MSRLTNSIREKICKTAIQTAFAERVAKTAQEEHELGIACYEAVLPEAERVAASALPKSWVRQDNCLRFNANGWNVNLLINDIVPVPYSADCRNLGSLPPDLAERAQAHSQAKDALRSERWKAEAEMGGFLKQFGSIKKLREAWPEGEAFYAAYETEREGRNVPAVRVAEINKLLNLGVAA